MYAILNNGEPVILIEAKWVKEELQKHDSQLFRYFGTSKAKFAILTNGITYRFYTDLEETNKMDEKPFLEINMLDIKEAQVAELKKFKKSAFSIDEIFNTASPLKYSNEIKNVFAQDLQNPSDQLIKFSSVYSGQRTQNAIEKFRPIVKQSLNQFISEMMNDKIKTALGAEETKQIQDAAAVEAEAGKLSTKRSRKSMKIGAAYIRVSTDMQLELSPESQLKAIKDYAEKNDIILSNEFIFVDEGISGRKAEKRPAFMRMIGIAKTTPKPFDVILIWKFSRFARNREDSIVYKSMLRKQCGIDVVSISEQLGEDKTSILIEALLEAMDEYYSINLAEEVKRGMTEKVSRGGVVSSPPFGYVMGKDKFEIDPERAEIVRQIFDRFLLEHKTLAIAKWLNSMGISTKTGNTFANRTVKYILTNPVYIGKLRWNTNGKATATSRYIQTENTMIVDGGHEPIISKETFDKVQEVIAEMEKKYVKHSHQTPSAHMLKGIVRCSTCGATLCMAAKGKSLQCSKYMHGQCKVSHSVSISSINQAVINAMEESLMHDSFLVEPDFKPNNTESEQIKAQIKKERAKLQRVKAAYENGIDSMEEYKSNKKRLEESIDRLENQLNKNADPQEYMIDIKDEIFQAYEIVTNPEAGEELKNDVLRSLISKIVYDRATNSVEIFYKI